MFLFSWFFFWTKLNGILTLCNTSINFRLFYMFKVFFSKQSSIFLSFLSFHPHQCIVEIFRSYFRKAIGIFFCLLLGRHPSGKLYVSQLSSSLAPHLLLLILPPSPTYSGNIPRTLSQSDGEEIGAGFQIAGCAGFHLFPFPGPQL